MVEISAMDWERCGELVSWNIVNNAASSSTMAGVLAGFSITASTVLFTQSDRSGMSHILGVFWSGTLALSLSSYAFNAITGVQEDVLFYPEGGRCVQLWSQGLTAMGLMVTGVAIVIFGLGWMLVAYANRSTRERYEDLKKYKAAVDISSLKHDKVVVEQIKKEVGQILESRKFLLKLNGFLTAGIVAGSLFILTAWLLAYIKAIGFDGHGWTAAMRGAVAIAVAIALLAFCIIYLRTGAMISRGIKAKTDECTLLEKYCEPHFKIPEPSHHMLKSDSQSLTDLAHSADSSWGYEYDNIRGVAYSVVGLSITSIFWVVIETQGWIADIIDEGLGGVIFSAFVSVLLGVVTPVCIFLLLAASVPTYRNEDIPPGESAPCCCE